MLAFHHFEPQKDGDFRGLARPQQKTQKDLSHQRPKDKFNQSENPQPVVGLSLQAAIDRQCQAHDRTSVHAKGVGEHRARLAGQGEPITARGVEQAAPRDHIAAAGEGRLGDIFE